MFDVLISPAQKPKHTYDFILFRTVLNTWFLAFYTVFLYTNCRLFRLFYVYCSILITQKILYMETKTAKAKATEKKTATPKNADAKKTTTKNGNSNPKNVEKEVQTAKAKVDEILKPSADSRIKRLETFNRLAERKNKIDTKLDELVNFRTSNDGTNQKMEFTADNGYRFTISNNLTIFQLLDHVERELYKLQDETETEIVNFQI